MKTTLRLRSPSFTNFCVSLVYLTSAIFFISSVHIRLGNLTLFLYSVFVCRKENQLLLFIHVMCSITFSFYIFYTTLNLRVFYRGFNVIYSYIIIAIIRNYYYLLHNVVQKKIIKLIILVTVRNLHG